jgi:dethiobiotin synthetase
MKYFVTAIGTDSGKTLFSAILTEALLADYWKPVQSGSPRDTETVQSLITNHQSIFHPEAYLLTQPLSPHASAAFDDVAIDLNKIQLPDTQNHLVIEGAGGVLVPLNDHDFVIDLAERLADEVILVANLYLGSINHTLLTLNELKKREQSGRLRLRGIVFNHAPMPSSEEIILKHANLPCLLRIAHEHLPDQATVLRYAAQLRENLKPL